MVFSRSAQTSSVISSPRGTFQVARSSVSKVTTANLYPWLFAGIKVYHLAQACPKNIQFKPMGTKSRDVLKKLHELGYR